MRGERWARAWNLPSAALVRTFEQQECRDWLDWSGRVFLGRFSFLLWSLAGRESTPKTIAGTIDLSSESQGRELRQADDEDRHRHGLGGHHRHRLLILGARARELRCELFPPCIITL